MGGTGLRRSLQPVSPFSFFATFLPASCTPFDAEGRLDEILMQTNI
jgi:hypothetical protein